MNLKRYRVKNIKEALAFIKRDLGPDALIVSTRQVKEGKGAFGMFGKTMLEVTAAASEAKKPSAFAKTSSDAPVSQKATAAIMPIISTVPVLANVLSLIKKTFYR